MNQNMFNISYEVVLLLLEGPMHGRRIARRLGMPTTNVQRALHALEEGNVIDHETEGRNKAYFVKRNMVAKAHVLNAENYKRVKVLRTYPLLEPVLDGVLKACDSRLVLLYGSYARGAAGRDSDIDIYIETQDAEVKRKVEAVNSSLSVEIGRFDPESNLIKEIIKNHVVVRGGEALYDRLKVLG